jgi:hypothetical protein
MPCWGFFKRPQFVFDRIGVQLKMKHQLKPSLATLNDGDRLFVQESSAVTLSGYLPDAAQAQLVRMFRDPYVLEQSERTALILQIQEAVALQPAVPELRVLLGMVLCVDLKVHPALEELREAVKSAPDNFLARLKFGELLMRLRICEQAAEETRMAALLASNPVQSELARRQAAVIRTMRQEGIERGGYSGLLAKTAHLLQKLGRINRRAKQGEATAMVGPG